MDEATSALDSVTERYIQESVKKLMQHHTTIVIAHRLTTLLMMDRILVFDHGRIIEDGTHHDLLAQKGGTGNCGIRILMDLSPMRQPLSINVCWRVFGICSR